MEAAQGGPTETLAAYMAKFYRAKRGSKRRAEHRRGECNQDDDCGDQQRTRAGDGRLAPAAEHRAGTCGLGFVALAQERHLEPVDLVTDEGEQTWQQIDAVHADCPQPTEVIQARIVKARGCFSDTCTCGYFCWNAANCVAASGKRPSSNDSRPK